MELSLQSSGLIWDEERLAGRYAFLRRRRHAVKLELLYYPYWLFHVQASAAWRFFGEKPLEALLVADACTGKCQRVTSFPQCREERIAFRTAGEPDDFTSAVLESDGATREVSAHVVRPAYEEEDAAARVEEFALSLWRRRCNLPLGPRADIRCTGRSPLFLYKPFWVMRPEAAPESGPGKMFIFDATTGLGGVSEYWNVVEHVLDIQKKADGEHV